MSERDIVDRLQDFERALDDGCNGRGRDLVASARAEIASLRAQLAETLHQLGAVSARFMGENEHLKMQITEENNKWLAIAGGLRTQLAKAEAQIETLQQASGLPAKRIREFEAQLASARKVAIEECMEKIGSLRQSEAGLFDAAHSGERGEDRSTALYDAYHLLRKLATDEKSGS